jgi:hypothetical protein
MGRLKWFALAAVLLLTLPLAMSYINSFDPWMILIVVGIVIILLAMAFVPRREEPELKGEDKYHLHP